jgi:hypothetical protein
MPVIDLTRYIVASAGTWTDPSQDKNLFDFTVADTMSPERLLLRWAGDFVALTGPLSVRITVQAENMTVPLALVGNLVPDPAAVFTRDGATTATLSRTTTLNEASLGRYVSGRGLSLQASTIYDYTLDIAAGQAWPFSLSEQLDVLRLRGAASYRGEQLGNNLGYRVIIEPAFSVARLQIATTGTDLPCDFAAADQPNTASFFPVACEPCEGSVIGLPPSGGVSLVIPPAEGGCVRTRFFNGMFITREDLETEQRYLRVKNQLHNRAAGDGVVWGLAVCRQGSAVWVAPGYGVDCCGNDLALTTTYKIDIAALLADPAAAGLVRQRGQQRISLLLEYVECPSDPRPVHGDPCAPQANRCEMSRIRESVRLRLVPPRDYKTAVESGPIGRFLDEVRELRSRYPLKPVPVTEGATSAPFQLRITAVNVDDQQPNVVMVRPAPSFNNQLFHPLFPTNPLGTVTVDVISDPLWTFVQGTQSGVITSGQQTSGDGVQPPNPLDLSQTGLGTSNLQTVFSLSSLKEHPEQFVFKLSGWKVQRVLGAEDDPVVQGDLTVTFRLSGLQFKEIELVETQIESRPFELADAPCDGDPCGPTNTFTNVFSAASVLKAGTESSTDFFGPWLHADPTHPARAGDPKALMMAALGGWLSQMLVRERAGTANEVKTARRSIAEGIYQASWLLLFGITQSADKAQLGGTLKRLLEGWCDDLLWRGPQCCGEPHGVVIGCAVVEAGTIRSIDPFGGRRYVVHYPLLAHWGAQFGIAPPDITLTRFFSKICCLAGLPALGSTTSQVSVGFIEMGGGYLAVGDPERMVEEMRKRKMELVGRRNAALPEMIASAITALSAKRNPDSTQYTAVMLETLVADGTVMLLLPA